MKYMITYLTCEKWIGYNLHVRPSLQGQGGGMAVKTQRMVEALGKRYYVQIVSDIEKIQAPFIIVEPLYFRLFNDAEKEKELHWERLTALGELSSQGRKLLLACSEFELMRWSPDFRTAIQRTFDIITCNCKYQENMFSYVDISPRGILCDPIPTDIFCPVETRNNRVIATGHVSWQKNAEQVIETFAELQRNGIETCYVGSSDLWGKSKDEHNKSLERKLREFTDYFHSSLAQYEIIKAMQDSKIGLWVANHECFGTGYAEMLSTGLPVITHNHGLAYERPSPIPSQDGNVETIVRLLTDDEEWEAESLRAREWAVANVDYDVFLKQLSEVL